MKKENKQNLYASPKVEVIEMKARQVMCVSVGATTENYEDVNDFGW